MPRLAIAILLASACFASDPATTLWYRQPAAKWTEALPVGNGRLGAMIFGGVADERIQLNEGTVWAGEKRDRNNPAGAAAIPEIRRLLFAGKPHDAEVLAEKDVISIPKRLPPYQTLGDLRLTFPGHDAPANYRRELDLDTAVVRVTYRIDGATYTREVFSSAPDQLIVIRLTCDKPNRISLRAALTREQDATTKAAPDGLTMDGEAIVRDARHDGERKVGMKFHAVLKALHDGGTTRADGNDLLIDQANSATLFLAAGTNFNANDAPAQCARQLQSTRKSYDQLRAAHMGDYRQYFRRVKFTIGNTPAKDVPTDELLKHPEDPQLTTLYFQFGRYLLISSSRPGGLPATLQGLWNESLAPSWDSKYTININTEMNYWPAEVANLSEMHLPLFDLVDRTREDGRRIARELYHAQGFVLHHNTDIWGDAVPIDGVGSGVWPMGAAWLSLHYWDHYDFTRDRAFLAQRAYPVMKEAAAFLLDYMVEDGNGHLVTGPSLSPENQYRTADGVKAKLCMGPYMDTEIAYALFTRILEAADVLGTDAPFRAKVAAARGRLAPLKIGSHGQLQEWLEDYDEPEPGHRHMSHLFALHPGNQITPRLTPEFAKAARVTLDRRLASGGGHTGWSRAWIINFWARLGEGDLAEENIRALFAKSTLPNLLDTHPPFQIDGNFGATAGMTEMLLQSHAGEIALLPALPQSWRNGYVSGLRARGAVELELSWSDGKATDVVLKPTKDGEFKIRAPRGQQVASVEEAKGALKFDNQGEGLATVKLRAGHIYSLRFRSF
jgi:alpha-L-fucosidase 2